MIGYVTLGSDNMPRARAYYDELLGSSVGAKRIMEFGDEEHGFTMWGTGFDKPGLAVTNPVLSALVENTSGNTVRARLWRGRLDPDADARTVTEHRLIYEAILDRDSERARLRAAAHILGVEDAVRALASSPAVS